MLFSNNIKLLRKLKGLTQNQAAEILEMKRSTLSGYENEVSQPTVQTLQIFSKFHNVSIDTLLNVDMSKLSENQLKNLVKGDDAFLKGSSLRILTTTLSADNEENIELVPEKAKAGYATGFADPEYIKELPAFQLPFLSKNRKYRTFQLSGDSMLPIPHGAWVTGEFLQDWNLIETGQAYVIFTIEDGIVFKIVESFIRDNGILRLFSLNPLYEPYDIHVNSVKEVWRFINFISSEIPEPILPQDELLKTVAHLKQDMEKVKLRLQNRKPEA